MGTFLIVCGTAKTPIPTGHVEDTAASRRAEGVISTTLGRVHRPTCVRVPCCYVRRVRLSQQSTLKLLHCRDGGSVRFSALGADSSSGLCQGLLPICRESGRFFAGATAVRRQPGACCPGSCIVLSKFCSGIHRLPVGWSLSTSRCLIAWFRSPAPWDRPQDTAQR